MEELILKQREFKENLIKLINDSKLPAMIIKPIIKEAFEQLDLVEAEQYNLAINKKKKDEEAKEEKIDGNIPQEKLDK